MLSKYLLNEQTKSKEQRRKGQRVYNLVYFRLQEQLVQRDWEQQMSDPG